MTRSITILTKIEKHFEYDLPLEICEIQLSSSLRDHVIYKLK